MNKNSFRIVACLLLAAVATSACNQQQAAAPPPPAPVAPPPPPPPDPLVIDAKLKMDAAPFVMIAKTALTATPANMPMDISMAESAAMDAHDALGSGAADVDMRLADMRTAIMAKKPLDLAMAAAEAYRIIISAQMGSPKVPMAVDMLSYATIRYEAGRRARPAKWDDMTEAANLASMQWMQIADRVTDAMLKSDLEKAVAAMQMSAMRKQNAAAQRAAKTAMDSADKLEMQFASG